MKKSILSVIALTSALMISCVKSEEPIAENGYTFRFEISGENDTDAKATMNDNYLVWEQEDLMDFILEQDGNVKWNAKTKIEFVDSRPSFSFTTNADHCGPLSEGNRIFCCYPRISNWAREHGFISHTQHITLPFIQTHKGGQFSGKNMPMVSVPFTLTSEIIDKRVGKMKFLNLGAMLEFKVFSSDGAHSGEIVQDVIFEADKRIAGAFSFNLQNVNPDDEKTLAINLEGDLSIEYNGILPRANMIRTESDATVGTTKDNAGSVRMVVAPGTYTGKVNVRTNKGYYVFNVTNKTFARNGHYPLGLDLSSATCMSMVVERMDQTQWKTIFCNTTDGYETWGYPALNDGNFNTVWQNAIWKDKVGADTDDLDYTKLENEGIYVCTMRRYIPDIAIVVDLKQTVNVARIGIATRIEGWPNDQSLKDCEFYVGDSFKFKTYKEGGSLANYNTLDDENDWKLVITATEVPKEDLGGLYWFDVEPSVSEADRTGRYLKIRPTASHRGNSICAFAELLLEYVPTAEAQ